MSYLLRIVALVFLTGLVISCDHTTEHQSEPSVGATHMAGANGTFEFKPNDWNSGKVSWWKDSDGVSPGVAGCHIGTDKDGFPNGRKFGEACLSNGHLVESNPAKYELHSHKDDIGHPDTFDCNVWCKGNGKESGICEIASAPPCDSSAICVCD